MTDKATTAPAELPTYFLKTDDVIASLKGLIRYARKGTRRRSKLDAAIMAIVPDSVVSLSDQDVLDIVRGLKNTSGPAAWAEAVDRKVNLLRRLISTATFDDLKNGDEVYFVGHKGGIRTGVVENLGDWGFRLRPFGGYSRSYFTSREGYRIKKAEDAHVDNASLAREAVLSEPTPASEATPAEKTDPVFLDLRPGDMVSLRPDRTKDCKDFVVRGSLTAGTSRVVTVEDADDDQNVVNLTTERWTAWEGEKVEDPTDPSYLFHMLKPGDIISIFGQEMTVEFVRSGLGAFGRDGSLISFDKEKCVVGSLRLIKSFEGEPTPCDTSNEYFEEFQSLKEGDWVTFPDLGEYIVTGFSPCTFPTNSLVCLQSSQGENLRMEFPAYQRKYGKRLLHREDATFTKPKADAHIKPEHLFDMLQVGDEISVDGRTGKVHTISYGLGRTTPFTVSIVREEGGLQGYTLETFVKGNGRLISKASTPVAEDNAEPQAEKNPITIDAILERVKPYILQAPSGSKLEASLSPIYLMFCPSFKAGHVDYVRAGVVVRLLLKAFGTADEKASAEFLSIITDLTAYIPDGPKGIFSQATTDYLAKIEKAYESIKSR